jgi:predicted choloylglycine hydrolase
VTAEHDSEQPATAAPDWQDWRQWVDGVDWSDWRSWLRRAAETNWGAASWAPAAAASTAAAPAAAAPADWTAAPWSGPSWEPPGGAGQVSLALRAFAEDEPGDEIAGHLRATWPAFRRWWHGGAQARPSAAQARARLEEHMPELVPVWQRLTAMLGDDPDAAAALALWNPPPFLTGCSQAAVLPGGPALIRNYDWDYRLFDAVVTRTGYGGRRVLGMLDCLWGLLDGVNDAGLAVSLTFGGRPQVGEGFGIPMVIRYVLQTCATAGEAVQALRRIPVHMSYNVTVLDRDGSRATVYLAPDRPAHATSRPVATNYPGKVEWAPYAAAIRTVERQERLEELLAAGADAPSVAAALLGPPLYATRFGEGFGTLYTAEYRPDEGVARYYWPGQTWEHSLTDLGPGRIEVRLGAA